MEPRIHPSWLGVVLCVLYMAVAVYVVQDELRHSGGGWISLRGMAVAIVTLPSQVTLGVVLKGLGVREVNYAEPGLAGYGQLVLHVVVCAAAAYLAGYWIEWGARRWRATGSASRRTPRPTDAAARR